MSELYTYYCTKCKIKITHDGPGFVICPQCKSGRDIMDYGDYEEQLWELNKHDYRWNKA